MKGKESWESTANGKAKDSICYANGSKLLFLSAVPAKEEGKESQSRNSTLQLIQSLIDNVEAEVQAIPWKPGVGADQKNDKISFQ